MTEPTQSLVEKVAACVSHADDLLESSKIVIAAGKVNIAFHLALLAIEEIGKGNLIMINSITERQDVPPSWPRRHTLDHEQKLFWALIGPELFQYKATQKQVNEIKSLSRTLHLKRLSALYVDATSDDATVPALAVDRDETENILGLAERLVEMAHLGQPREDIPKEELDRLEWFLSMSEDPEGRKRIFSKGSMDELAELGSVDKWVKWLQVQFDQATALSEAALARELERSNSLPDRGSKAKWRIRFRLRSASHSIRPKALAEWNREVDIINLKSVGKRKREILAEITLFDNVPIQELYHFAWGIARQFTVALNITSCGFFWWQFSEDKADWFEEITDLDNVSMEVKIGQTGHTIDWGERRVLTPEDMRRVILAFITMNRSRFGQRARDAAMDAYSGGLTYLAASDVHLPMERQAVSQFLQSMWLMAEEDGEWDPAEPFEPIFRSFVDAKKREFDEREDLLAIVRALDSARATGEPAIGPPLRPEHVSLVKLFVDWYYLEKIQPKALKQLADKGEDAV